MTRRDFVLKWLLYAAALLPVLALELYVFPRFPIFGLVPSLLPMSAVIVAMLEGPVAGLGFGLFVGVLHDALIPGVPGVIIVGMTLLGGAAGTLSRYGVQKNILGCLAGCAGALGIISVVRILYHLLRGTASLWRLLAVALPEIVLSLVFLPLIYAIFLWVHRRVPQVSLL